MAHDFSKNAALTDQALSRYAGGQGTFADPFGNPLLELLADDGGLDDLRFGAVLSPTPLDGLFTHQDEEGRPIATTPTVKFDQGKPVVHAVSQDPVDGSTREIRTHLDAAGAIRQTEETRKTTEGLLEITEAAYSPLGNYVQVRQEDAMGAVLESHGRFTLQMPEAGGAQRLETLITTRPEGNAWIQLIQRDADGAVLETYEIEAQATQGGRVQQATLLRANGMSHEVTLYFRRESSEEASEDESTGEGEERAGTALRSLDRVEVQSRLQDDYNFATSTGIYHVNGMAEALSLNRLANGDEVERYVTYHVDGSTKIDERTYFFGGDDVRDVRVTAADGRLLEETHGHKVRNGEFTETTTVYHADGSTHETRTRQDAQWQTLELVRTMSHPDGSQNIEMETYPNGGTRTAIANKGPDGALRDEAITLLRADGSTLVETRTYFPGGFDSFTEDQDADGNVTSQTEARQTPTADGGTYYRSVTTEPETTVELTMTHDAEGHLLQDNRTVITHRGTVHQELKTYTPDGSFYQFTYRVTDSAGNVTSHYVETVEWDADGVKKSDDATYYPDGRTSRTTKLQHPERGIFETSYINSHPQPDGGMRIEVESWEGNFAGPKTESTIVQNAEGARISLVSLKTNPPNFGETRHEWTALADGFQQDVMTRTDGSGTQTVTILTDPDGNQSVNVIARDLAERLVREESHRVDPNGTTTESTVTLYDSAGSKEITTTGRDSDGRITVSLEGRNAADQRVHTRDRITDPDMSETETERYFTSDGQLLSESESFKDPDGKVRASIHTIIRRDPIAGDEVQTVTTREDGTRTWLTTTTKNGQVIRRETSDFDETGAEKRHSFWVEADGSMRETLVDFDKDKQPVASSGTTRSTDADGNESIVTFSHAAGNQIDREETRRASDGVLLSSTEIRQNPDGSRVQEEMVRASDTVTRLQTWRYGTDKALVEYVVRETTADAGGVLAITLFVEHPADNSWREEAIRQDADGTILSRIVTEAKRSIDGLGNETVERRIQYNDGAILETTEIRDASQQLIEQHSTRTETDETGVTTRRKVVTRSDASSREEKTLTHPDGLVVEEIFDRASSGATTRVTTRTQGGEPLDTTTVSTFLDAQFNSVEETRVERPDNSRSTTIVTRTMGGQTRVETERAADGSELVTTIATPSDGTRSETVVRKDIAGHTLETRTTDTASDGTRTRVVTTPLSGGATRKLTTELAADETVLATVETLTQPDGSREETRVTPLPDGQSQTVRTLTDANGAWVSTHVTTTLADGNLTREVSEPLEEGGTRTRFIREDADGNELEARETLETTTEANGIRRHAAVTTSSTGATREVITLSLVNGSTYETTVIETSQDAQRNVLTQTVTKRVNGSGIEERVLKSPASVELSYSRVETEIGGATVHLTRTRQNDGATREEAGIRTRDGQIITWTTTETVPQADGSERVTRVIEETHETRRLVLKRADGHETTLSDVTSTWGHTASTETFSDGSTRKSEEWLDTDGVTVLERRIVTTGSDGRKTIETWRQTNDNLSIAQYDAGDILRSITTTQTDANGAKTSYVATYQVNGSPLYEETQNRTAGGALIFKSVTDVFPDGTRLERWEDHSQAPFKHVILTQKDAHGALLKSTDTETRRMPDMSEVETVREVHADGRHVEIKTYKTPDGEERRVESTLTHADGSTLYTLRERYADGSTWELEDRSNTDGSGTMTTTRKDAQGIRTVEYENWTSETENVRLVTVKDANDQLLSETETRRHPVQGLKERIRLYDAEGYSEQITNQWLNHTVVHIAKRVNASGQVLSETTTKSLTDNTREVFVNEYDAAGRRLRASRQFFILGDLLRESSETVFRPEGGSVTVQTTIGGISASGSRIVKDADDVEIEQSSWRETDTYHHATGSVIKTRTDWHADGTIFERREQIGLMGAVYEIVETFTDTDGSQNVKRLHNIINGRLASDDTLVAHRWTETVTRLSPTSEVLETSTTTTLTLPDGNERQERLITRADGSSQTDLRIVAADETVLEFRQTERTPHPDGKVTLETDARFQDGRILDEVTEIDALGGRTTTARTQWPNGDVRVVETVVAADETLLSRVDTHTRAEDGQKTIHRLQNTRHGDPQKGTIIETEQVFDASETLSFATSATQFANGSRFESRFDTANGETVHAQVEYEADGRRLYGYSETTAADGRRTIVADKEHIDGSRERIETTLDAKQQPIAYKHTLTDALGQVHVIDDPHVPAKRPALVGVTRLPVVFSAPGTGRRETERTLYTYADGSTVNEAHEYGYWYTTRFHIRHTKTASQVGLIYQQEWHGNSGLIDKNTYAPSGTRYETGFDNFKSIHILGKNESEYISWVHDGETHVIRRNPYNKAAFYSGSYASIGNGQTSFRYTSPDGNWEMTGIKGRGGDHHDAHSQAQLHRSTEIFHDPGAGTKRVIERVPGKDGGNQVADLRYALEADGTYRRTGATIASTYADKSTINVEQTYDAQGQLTTEVHRYRSANGNRLVTTTIKHQADGSSTSTAVYTLSGYHSKTETVETRVSGGTETVTTRVVDAKDQLTTHTVAVTTNGVQTKTHYQDGRVTQVEIADVTVTTHPDGRLEKNYKTRGSDIVTTLRWGPHGEYAGGSKVITSSDGSLVTSELFAPDGNKTITLVEKKDGQITSITTSHVDPYGFVSNVSRTENLSIADPLTKIAADQLMKKLGFDFVQQPDGSQKIDFSKRVKGLPFTVDGLDFSKVGIDLDKNPIESMTDAFLDISNGKGGPDAYAKLIGSLVLTMKDAKGNPGVMAGYLAFCGIDMALKETPFGAQWLGIKQELNDYLNVGINAGAFAAVDIPFKFIDDLTGGAATDWLRENGMGNALDALMNPNVLLGTPGEMLTNMARSLVTGGAYAPVKLIYNMLPDGVQDMIDDALHQVPGYSQVTYGLGLASGYIDDGVHTGIRYAHRYAEVGLAEAFNAQNYVIAADSIVALSESFAQHATTYANVVGDSLAYAFGRFVDVTEQFGSLIKDIGNQGIAAAAHLANSVYGGLKSLANSVADKASDAWNAAKDAASSVGSWLGL